VKPRHDWRGGRRRLRPAPAHDTRQLARLRAGGWSDWA
jgi:hypothetical protein